MPLESSLLNSHLPTSPFITLAYVASSGKRFGRSSASNSLAPSGANFAVEGASICTEPSCSASISSLSLNNDEFGYTSTFTLPPVYLSASYLNLSTPLPFGVSLATTWLNLMMIGDCAAAGPATVLSAHRTAVRTNSAFFVFESSRPFLPRTTAVHLSKRLDDTNGKAGYHNFR